MITVTIKFFVTSNKESCFSIFFFNVLNINKVEYLRSYRNEKTGYSE